MPMEGDLAVTPSRRLRVASGAIAQQQPRQSGDVHGDAARLVLGKAIVHGAPLRLIVEIHVGEILPVRVGDDEAFFEPDQGAGRGVPALAAQLGYGSNHRRHHGGIAG